MVEWIKALYCNAIDTLTGSNPHNVHSIYTYMYQSKYSLQQYIVTTHILSSDETRVRPDARRKYILRT